MLETPKAIGYCRYVRTIQPVKNLNDKAMDNQQGTENRDPQRLHVETKKKNLVRYSPIRWGMVGDT
jgi:hypothetical protein